MVAGIKLGTLKECLQFLHWLHNGKLGKGMQSLISSRLKRLLEKRYNTVNPTQIENALSAFLSSVHTFHNKLCTSPRGSYAGPQTAKNVLNTLLDCVPKLLAAVYFLRYQVDRRFEALGGGGWADQQVGVIALYASLGGGLVAKFANMTGPVDKYLTAESGTDYGGVIPGGFDPSELRQGHLQGYSEASQMAGDLQSIMEKHAGQNKQNYFLDVYSTTVIPDSGADTANVANALRLVQDFCRIFGKIENKEDFEKHLYTKHKCIDMEQLKTHCKILNESLGKIFTASRFSFTGYARQDEFLIDQYIAKKMASWFKQNLHKVKDSVKNIKAFSDVSHLKKLKGSKALRPEESKALQNYFTNNFITYGFTFYSNSYTTKNAPYDLLQKEWDSAIRELKSSDGGLQRLVEILNGQQCQAQEEQRKQRRNERQDDDQPEEIDEEALEEPADELLREDGQIVEVIPPKKPEVPPAKVSEVTEKKADGTPNQGKKAEGTPNQNNGRSGDTSSGSATVKSPAPAAPPGKDGGSGPAGPTGQVTTMSSSAQDTSVRSGDHTQRTADTVSPVPPLPPPPPSGPASSGMPGVQGQGSPAGVPTGHQSAPPHGNVLTQHTGVSGSSPGSPGCQVTGQNAGQDASQQITQLTSQVVDQNVSSGATPSGVKTSSKVIVRDNFGDGGQAGKDDSWWGENEWIYKEDVKGKWIRKQQEDEWLKTQEQKDLEQQRRLQQHLRRFQQHKSRYTAPTPITIPEPIDFSVDGNVVYYDSDTELQGKRDVFDLRNERYMNSLRVETLRKIEEKHKLQKEAAGRYKTYEEHKYIKGQQDAGDVFTGIVPSNAGGMPKVSVPKVLASIVPIGYPIKPPKWSRPPKNPQQVRSMLDVTSHRVLQPDPMRSTIPSETIAPPMSLMTEFSGSPTDEAKGGFRISALPQIDFQIDKPYTPDVIYDAERIQYIPPPAVRHKNIASPSDIPPHAPFPETFDPGSLEFPTADLCLPPWITQTPTHDSTDFPETELFPSEVPRTVRDMLIWLAGLQHKKHQETLQKCINNAFKRGDYDASDLRLSVNGADIRPENVLNILKLPSVFAASVITAIEPNWRVAISSVTLASKDSDQSKDPDCCALLCQLRDYVYACYYQLAFLKSQCNRNTKEGGWQDCQYGRDAKMSPLQSFLTDAPNSKFKTHPFDPGDICLKSRVNMGFEEEDLPATQQTGNTLSTIFSPTCGGEDPLLTLTSYLNCLTRRTPRTTGELVSFFHNFGNALNDAFSDKLLPLGSALSKSHDHCPDWDSLGDADLNALKVFRGSATPNSNSIHDKDHPKTLSTLLGCDITNANCPQLLKPITYRAYALYSSSFVHHYLSWVAYLSDRLWESLKKLSIDMKKHYGTKCLSLHQCPEALPLLYTHGFTAPEGTLQSRISCSKVSAKLEAVVSGKPIARLMTAMDTFLYGIRLPFLYTIITLWLIATLYILGVLLYRMDVLRIRSHLRTPTSL
ncbi:Ribosome-binding protein 1 [Babesia ovata]|uniref:Ribosome-binding protein 1 n=1 Tax=Babesia ovata TaxID=189622 RepID=A0A2H6KHT9_9APIC|nr:Ribosome-binding protein 1 [Babesia ovata]GBE62558.1 Ribosome-binding protein 1 [Babesia ovata]